MKRKITTLLVITLLLTACSDKWHRIEVAFNVGAPRVIARFESQGKLSSDEASALRQNIPLVVTDIKAKDFGAVTVHLGNIARVKIKNREAKQWLDDLVAVASVILGVDTTIDSGVQVNMKSMPKQAKPDLSEEKLKRLEALTK